MDDLFATVSIKFNNRDEFNSAIAMNTFADDIGHSDMVLVYSKKNTYFRDRFAGFLNLQGIYNFYIKD